MYNIFFKTKKAFRIPVLNASIHFESAWQYLLIPPTLSIVLLAGNVTRRAILGRTDPGTLFGGHHSVRVGSVLHPVDTILLPLKTIGFPPIQLPARNPLINSLLLIHLTLIDDRSLGLCEGYTARQDEHPAYCDQHRLHHDLLKKMDIPFACCMWRPHALLADRTRRGFVQASLSTYQDTG